MSFTEQEIVLAYRLMLDRVPSAAEIAHMQAHHDDAAALRQTFVAAPEFRRQFPQAAVAPPPRRPRAPHEVLYHYYSGFDAPGTIAAHARNDVQPEPGFVKNFLGLKIPAAIHPSQLTAMLGKVEGPPDPGNWHADIAEWAAALRTVGLAQDRYRIVELGCGWGCWLSNTGLAARARGLAVDLIGIEGDPNHLANAREVLLLNGFDPSEFALNHGIAAPRPGKAIFPLHEGGPTNWGGQAVFHPDKATLAAAEKDPAAQVLDCMTLEMLSGGQTIDLLHIDIQGAETDYVRGNMQDIARLVRRVLIGTHSRVIEGELTAHFLAAGWRLEMERPAVAPIRNGQPVIGIDGVQMWANPALS